MDGGKDKGLFAVSAKPVFFFSFWTVPVITRFHHVFLMVELRFTGTHH